METSKNSFFRDPLIIVDYYLAMIRIDFYQETDINLFLIFKWSFFNMKYLEDYV